MRNHVPKLYLTTPLTDLNMEFLNNAKKIYSQGTAVLKDEAEVLDMFPLCILGCMKHPVLNLHAFKSKFSNQLSCN